MKGVIKHYRWSWVGNLLFDLPGVEYQDVSINEDEVVKDNGDLKAIFGDMIRNILNMMKMAI